MNPLNMGKSSPPAEPTDADSAGATSGSTGTDNVGNDPDPDPDRSPSANDVGPDVFDKRYVDDDDLKAAFEFSGEGEGDDDFFGDNANPFGAHSDAEVAAAATVAEPETYQEVGDAFTDSTGLGVATVAQGRRRLTDSVGTYSALTSAVSDCE